MSKFNVGDKVKIVDSGYGYTTYVDFITSVLPEKIKLWQKGRRIKNGDYKVLASHIHTIIPDDGMLYIVENLEGTEVYIIGEKGLKLVEPALPRICYILGGEDTPLKIGEKFEVKGYFDSKLWVDPDGIVMIQYPFENTPRNASDALQNAINHPEKIIRKPKIEFSDDEKAFMRLLSSVGVNWIARDKEVKYLYAYDEKPVQRNGGSFLCSDGRAYALHRKLFPKITFENSPINMEDYI